MTVAPKDAATCRVLLLGGVDPSGGAGITLDATVVAIRRAQPLPVAVALTAQNRAGFREAFPVPEAHWRAAFDAACDDGPVDAIKLGFLGDAATIAAVAAAVRPFSGRAPIVVDPVLSATAGGLVPGAEVIESYREHLAPLATVVTPNLPELAALFHGDAHAALALGAAAVLVKGGHGDGPRAIDTVVTGEGERQLSRPRLDVGAVRGTGCALASALAVGLASGDAVVDACERAGAFVADRLAAMGPPPADGRPRPLALR